MKLEDIPEEQREKLRQNIRSFFPAREKVTEDNKRIFEALSKKSPVPVHVRESPTSLYSGGGAFHFGEKEPDFIELHPLASEHPATLAHELGHAYFRKESPYAKYIQNRLTAGAHVLSLPISQAAGYAAGLGLKTPAKYLVAPLTALALNAPRLYDEHQAWNRAERLLKAENATPEDMAYAAALRKRALTSYWVVPAASALTGLSTTGLGSYLKTKLANAIDPDALKTAAAKTVLAHYGLHKLATAPDSNVHQDVGTYRFNRTAESADIDDSKQYVFKAHDRKPQVTGNESAHAVPFLEGVSG